MATNRLFALAFAVLICTVCVDRASADTFGSGANAFDIEFVTIGDPGNPADTTGNPNPAGSVPYRYRIGKFEISEQMVDKANALGGLNITQDTHRPGPGDTPATSVSWNEAARFVNWLNTSTGSLPAYKFAIQPGEPGYNLLQDILLWGPGDPGYDPTNLYRNRLARYFLPSIDEWYKAAYYDATSDYYFNYPTGSDTVPSSVASGTDPGTAVWSEGGPAEIMRAGGLSPYGTMAQGGNVYEWQETEADLLNDSSVSFRVYRGGRWTSLGGTLSSAQRFQDRPSAGATQIGFRVAGAIPEPSTLLLTALAASGLLAVSQRQRH